MTNKPPTFFELKVLEGSGRGSFVKRDAITRWGLICQTQGLFLGVISLSGCARKFFNNRDQSAICPRCDFTTSDFNPSRLPIYLYFNLVLSPGLTNFDYILIHLTLTCLLANLNLFLFFLMHFFIVSSRVCRDYFKSR